MTKELVQEGFALAEKECREKQVREVKGIVLKTLEKIKVSSEKRDKLSREIKILKMDLDDIKEGKLDRIVERQEKDEEAKKVSVVIIIKEKEIIREVSPWYIPYRWHWNYPIVENPITVCGLGSTLTATYNSAVDAQFSTINCSVAKDASVGVYQLDGGVVKNFR